MFDPKQETLQISIALEASGIGTWQFDVASGRMILDPISQKLLGFNDNENISCNDLFEKVTQKSRNEVTKAIEASILLRKCIDIKYRTIADKNGKTNFIH